MAEELRFIHITLESEATTSGSVDGLSPGASLGVSDEQDVTSVSCGSSAGQAVLSPRREL